MVALFGYPNRQAGVKTSSYVESYEYVEVYDVNTRMFLIEFITHRHMKVNIGVYGNLS